MVESFPKQFGQATTAVVLQRLIRIESDLLQILRTSGSQSFAVFEAHAFVRQAIQSLSKEDAPKSARCEDGSVTNG